MAFVVELVEDPLFRRGMSILVDHLALDPSPLRAADIKAQANLVGLLNERLGPCRVAIVVPNTLGFGFARMYELHAAETQIRSCVFYSRTEAVAWLAAQADELAPQEVG